MSVVAKKSGQQKKGITGEEKNIRYFVEANACHDFFITLVQGLQKSGLSCTCWSTHFHDKW